MIKNKIKTIGITGQSGFIGSYLKNFISYIDDSNLKIVDFQDNFFVYDKKLQEFVSKCDTIIHLAGMSRGDEKEIYDTNINLTKKLIDSMDKTGTKARIIFASSLHEKTQNSFGKSKKDSRIMLDKWSKKNNLAFSGLIIPHVFGPGAKPFHNSALATFCFQLTNNKKTKIIHDSDLQLIYVENLVKKILEIIKNGSNDSKTEVMPDKIIKVSGLLKKLELFNNLYSKENTIPSLVDEFDMNLFNTYHSYFGRNNRKVSLIKHSDSRGFFCEMTKTISGGQVSFSISKPGVTRGDHFHKNKIERICIIDGKAVIKIRKIGEKKIQSYKVSGDRPAVIDMPIWYTHNIENVSTKPLIMTLFSKEIFDPNNPDTYHEKV